jgi:hypothetical protein
MSKLLKPNAIQPDGVTRAARYGFGPNRLHLCGPDANRDVFAYLEAGVSDPGLQYLLKGFSTLYPYLQEIAQANGIADPFDDRVVEAYWVGNALLEVVPQQRFYRHLRDSLDLKRKYPAREFSQLVAKLGQGARMHHNVHVLNAYKRTGHDAKLHTLESMDACRVSWGKVIKVEGPTVTVERQPLVQQERKFSLGSAVALKIRRRLEEDGSLDDLKVGDTVTIHWGVICEVIRPSNLRFLKHYTNLAIRLTNPTL